MDTVLLMVDLPNSCYATDGWREALGYPDIWRLDETVAECVVLMNACRDSGIPVIYTKGAKRADGADLIPRYAEAYVRARASLGPVSPEYQVWKSEIMDVAAPKPGDIVLEKPRWCAFQYTELEAIMRNLGTSRLIVAGLQALKILYAEVAPSRELLDPTMKWDRATSDADYGRSERVGTRR